MSLIEELYHGVNRGEIQQPFSSHEFKEWIEEYRITKSNGQPYKRNSQNALLSNSAKQNRGSSNKNRKMLNTRKNAYDQQEYWFDGVDE